MTCTGPGPCLKPAVAHGLCDAHRKQKVKGQTLRPLRPYRRGKDILYRAAIDYAMAVDDLALRQASARLRYAAQEYVRSAA